MAVSTLTALNAKLYGGSQRIVYGKVTSNLLVTGGGSCYSSHWLSGTPAGVAPTTAAICDRTTVGGLHSYGWQNKIGTEQRLWLERYDTSYSATIGPTVLLLVDRLASVGGFDGTVTTAQSNGAWPALTRSTNGVGVWAAVQIYTALGATATTGTLSYTDTTGAGSTSQPFDIGGSGRNSIGKVLPIPVANGDLGVKAVTSLTLAGSTATAGNFGVNLYKTYGMWMANNSAIPISHSGRPFPNFGPMPAIPDDACLEILCLTSINATIQIGANIRAFED